MQFSIDGPNVNCNTVEIINEYEEHDDPDVRDLTETGSCGLHALHRAYGTT